MGLSLTVMRLQSQSDRRVSLIFIFTSVFTLNSGERNRMKFDKISKKTDNFLKEVCRKRCQTERRVGIRS